MVRARHQRRRRDTPDRGHLRSTEYRLVSLRLVDTGLPLGLHRLDLQPQIAPEVMRVRDGKVESTNEIAFDRFLSHYDSEKISKEEELHSETSYRVQRHLFRLFTSLDVNHDGEISRSEFKSGIHALNRRLPENSRICHNDEDGLNTLFDTLDLDSSGDICVHEFSGLIERMIEDEFSSSSPPS